MVADRGRSRPSRKVRRAKYPNAQLESLLELPETEKAWGRQKVKQEKARLRGEKDRLRGKPQEHLGGGYAGGFICSEPWFEANWHHRAAYPPGGDNTLMLRCPECGTMVPPNGMEEGVCLDCRPEHVHEAHGGSPSARAIAEIQYRNLRLETITLAPEDASSLRREIKRFNKQQR